jgi:adenylate kinase
MKNHKLMRRIFILIGPPGSGKGTQAGGLIEKLRKKPKYFSVGEILRKEIEKGTDLGRQVERFVDKGLLVPDEIISEVIIKRIRVERGDIILDGFPRTLSQALILEKYLAEKETKNIVIEIALPKEQIILERISGRRYCPNGHLFHLKFDPPKKANICDYCGEKLKIRADADPKVIKERLKIYHKETKPLIKYYQGHHNYKFLKIDGSKEIKRVHDTLMKKIRPLL